MRGSREAVKPHREWLRESAFLALFTLVAVGLTYPLVIRLTSGIVGGVSDHEEATFAWNLWWTRYALFELGSNPFTTDYIFAPHTVDLRLHTFAPLHAILTLPVLDYWGAGAAQNAAVLLTIVLNGYIVYRLGRELGMTVPGAIVAGTLVAVAPTLTSPMRAGKPSFAAVWPIALALIFLRRLFLFRRLRDGVALGIALTAALFIDFQIVLYGVVWLALFGSWLLWRHPTALATRRFWSGLVVAVMIFAVPFSGNFFPTLREASAHGYPVPSAANTLTYSLYPSLYVTPRFLAAFFGHALPVAVIAAVATLGRSRGPLLWLGVGTVFIVLSMGVVLQPTELPLPFALLRRLPGVAQFRTPYRFTIPMTLAMALAAGVVWSYWSARLNRGAHALLLGIVMVALILDSRAVGPFERQPYPVAAIYHQIAAHPAQAAVLEVPVGLRSGTQRFGHDETLQYFQTIHRKPMINAMVARVPRDIFAYYRASPALSFLAGEPVDNPTGIASDLDEKLESLNIGWVIVHRDLLEAERAAMIERLLDDHPALTLVDEDPQLKVYATERVQPQR